MAEGSGAPPLVDAGCEAADGEPRATTSVAPLANTLVADGPIFAQFVFLIAMRQVDIGGALRRITKQ